MVSTESEVVPASAEATEAAQPAVVTTTEPDGKSCKRYIPSIGVTISVGC